MSSAAIITLNAGSSSLKFSVYAAGQEPSLLALGQVENLGGDSLLSMSSPHHDKQTHAIGQADHQAALQAILQYIQPIIAGRTVAGIGHRIVHGGAEYAEPRRLDAATLAYLHTLSPFAPLHQPHNLKAVTAAQAAFPDAIQIGCFDTAFHRGHTWANDAFALPRRFYEQGVRRYGFHGLSYQYVAGELARLAPEVAEKRVVIAHLGSGASMCALQYGRSVTSTMGFSALEGLPMGTRCGQIDPGVLLWMVDQGMSSAEITSLLYKDSGLKGLSGISNDMRTLEQAEQPEAAQAIEYFTTRIRREIGSMAALLGGLDALVFCGGIGEHAAKLRSQVCDNMAWLGIELDATQNAANATCISSGKVKVMVIPTDEERVIANAVNDALLNA